MQTTTWCAATLGNKAQFIQKSGKENKKGITVAMMDMGGIMWLLMGHFDLSCDGAGKSSERWLPGVPASPVQHHPSNKDDLVGD